MTIRNYIKVIEDIVKGENELAHFFVDQYDFKAYSHGPREIGFVDKSESTLTIKNMLEFLNDMGYKKVSGPTKIMKNLVSYSFEKSGGPYTDDILTFDTTTGKCVRNVTRSTITTHN